ncbi:MAG: hypothetical protein ACYTHM_02575 [Planctomycetota bacterium]|jgi:hypothetical protein
MLLRSGILASILLFGILPQVGFAGEVPEKNVFLSKAHGFRIARPDDRWAFHETGEPVQGTYRLVVYVKDQKERVMVTVRVKDPAAESPSAESLRDQALEWTKGKPAYTDASKTTMPIAGQSAPALAVTMKSGGETFRVRQGYRIQNGIVFTLGYHAPVKDFPTHLPTFLRICRTFRFVAPAPDVAKKTKLRNLAARCGTEIEWFTDWEKAASKARKEKKLLLVLVRAISGFQITNPFTAGTFMVPDILDLARHRFVAVRFRKGMGAPFESEAVYGLGPNTFGTSLLVVTPEGKVVGDTFSPEPSTVHDLLVEQLHAQAKWCTVIPPKGLKGKDLAEWYLRRGEYEMASGLLATPSSAREHRLRASLFQRKRMGKEALGELKKARAFGEERLEASLGIDEAFILIRMGKTQEAYSVLSSVLNRIPEGPHRPEALFWLGACAYRLAGRNSASAVWNDLIASHPENRWAWMAASAVTGTAFSLGLQGRMKWPSEELLAMLELKDLEKLEPFQSAKAEAEALEFLLRNQRPDGSWICATEVTQGPLKAPHEFTVAITAICALSLLAFRERPEVFRSIHLAVGFLLQAREMEKAVGNRVYFMDYTVWSKAYTLCFFSACIKEGLLKKKPLESMLLEIVSELQEKQKTGGGWSYYVTRNLRTAGQGSNQSISFTTAAVMLALFEAKAIDLPLPEKMVSGGIGCLERMRNPNGTFEYMLHHGAEKRRRTTAPQGAAGRGPVCSLALYRWGRGSLDEIRQALKTFAEHRKSYAKLKRKTLMHTAPHGQGSHYLMFDYAYASAALAQLSEEERAVFRGVLLDQVLDARAVDGSYLDNPMVGSHLGTAFALIAFRHLLSGK